MVAQVHATIADVYEWHNLFGRWCSATARLSGRPRKTCAAPLPRWPTAMEPQISYDWTYRPSTINMFDPSQGSTYNTSQ